MRVAARNSLTRWGAVSKLLHWAIATLMIAAIAIAVWAGQLDPEVESHRSLWQILIMKLHKPIGFTALVLILIRVAWAVSGSRPRLPDSMSRLEVGLSKLAHVALYLLMLIVPTTGWFMSQYADSPVNYFGLFEIGNVVAADKEMIKPLHTIHVTLGLVTLGLVVFHIAAAFFHEYVRKDGVLAAMLPGRSHPLAAPPDERAADDQDNRQ